MQQRREGANSRAGWHRTGAQADAINRVDTGPWGMAGRGLLDGMGRGNALRLPCNGARDDGQGL
ncbi:MAG TPA: hypothetical protein VFB60_01105 [Ktedonobacteraceae bacterium]|nr:hypothetical protein [Ktedonobacteraceae bacterium]